MIRLLPRRSYDVTYFTKDAALELDGLRCGGPGWWLRGSGDPRDPAAVSSVLRTSHRSVVVGYDIVIAAPRPISVLLAVDPTNGFGVIEAHRASVRASMHYLEDRALVVRERDGGVERETAGRWSSVVSFTHGLNRHGEPHLHDHVLVGARPESHANVLDSRALFAHVTAADALYRSSLRHELHERTPWSAWRSFEGVEHVLQLDQGYRALWSGHHRERGDKLSWSRDDAIAAWSKDIERFVPLGAVRTPEVQRRVLDEHRFAGAFEGRLDVARRHVLEAWANAAPFGQDPASVARSIDTLYPELRSRRGVHESTISLPEARMINPVHRLGARPLEERGLEEWRQRSRGLDRSRDARSR